MFNFILIKFNLKLSDIFFDGSVQLIQKYHQNLKSNIRIMQTGITKEYTFYQVGVNMRYSSFQQSNFNLFLPPISAVIDSVRIYKNSNLPSNTA